MITLIINLTVSENYVNTFKNVTSDMMKLSQTEKNCYNYSVYYSNNKFTFVETYTNNDALEAHKQSKYFQYWKKITTEMITNKSIEVLKELY